MRKLLGWGSDFFWLSVTIVFVLAVTLFLLHLAESHLGGVVGGVAGGIESAITPQG